MELRKYYCRKRWCLSERLHFAVELLTLCPEWFDPCEANATALRYILCDIHVNGGYATIVGYEVRVSVPFS